MSSYASNSTDNGAGKSSHPNVYDLLDKLCKTIMGRTGTATDQREVLRHVAQFFSNCHLALGTTLPYDEGTITTIITQHLNEFQAAGPSRGAGDTVEMFLNMHDELKATQLESRKRSALLTFLYFMADEKNSNGFPKHTSRSNSFHTLYRRPTGNKAPSSTSGASPRQFSMTTALNCLGGRNATAAVSDSTSATSIGTNDSTQYRDGSRHDLHMRSSAATLSQGTSGHRGHPLTRRYKPTTSLSDRCLSSDSEESVQQQDDIVQNVIYAFTGIEGKYLRKDVVTGYFKLNNQERSLDIVQASMMVRLAELGYYHDVVKSYTDPDSGLTALGLMGQGFIAALKNELTKYYGMVAILQEQLNQQHMAPLLAAYNNNNNNRGVVALRGGGKRDRLTLLKVLVWYVEPLHRLQWLARVGEACRGQKGGALASIIHRYLSKGDPSVKTLTTDLLMAVCQPMYNMLTHWLFEGELCDPHNEFFIEALDNVPTERLWHDKYRVRVPMLPQFITRDLANKMLVTGKSINFLGQLCEGKQTIRGRDELLACIEKNGEDIFAIVSDTELHASIETIYLTTSKRVLDIVVGPHQLLMHLHGMRRYLLLGQGDFVGLLMENLKRPELDKPARNVFTYDLQSTLDAVIRSTNPHYEEQNILNHLDLRMVSPCDGEIGWDIMSLQYKMDAPLSALLEPAMDIYQLLFKPLWRMKHMEHVLSTKIWKEQMAHAKPLRCMAAELKTLLYTLYLFTSEVVHFTHQMQYYILFEVIECSWVVLQEKLKHAKSLDDILNWHYDFLKTIKAGTFLESDAGTLFHSMEGVYDGIVMLDTWQDGFYKLCFEELNARKAFDAEKADSEKAGKFGVTAERQMERDQEHKIFEACLDKERLGLDKIKASHEQAVRNFLMALNSNDNPKLQLFGIRLDFNEYYKKRDQRLCVPLTFQHMRFSSFYSASNKCLLTNRYSNFK